MKRIFRFECEAKLKDKIVSSLNEGAGKCGVELRLEENAGSSESKFKGTVIGKADRVKFFMGETQRYFNCVNENG